MPRRQRQGRQTSGSMRGRVTMLNGVEGMVGETALVTREVGTSTRPGLVRARGEDWHAVSMFPGTTIGVGTTVVVADVERGLLVVYATDSA